MHAYMAGRACSACGVTHKLFYRGGQWFTPGKAYAYTCPATGQRCELVARDGDGRGAVGAIPAWGVFLDDVAGVAGG